jgi:predicted metal-dependent HD superfamily phosphohydrolase
MTSIYAGLNRKVVYHSPLHFLSILSFAQTNGISLENWELLAIYYHDAIYRPSSKKNEINSIQFMNSLLTDTGVKKEILTKASFGIQATAMHLDTHVDPDCEKILDLDLHGFSFHYEKYIINSENIHDEYINPDPLFDGITENEFVSGRIKFLNSLLSKGFIFRTEMFKNNWETIAKNNISQEIELLKKF